MNSLLQDIRYALRQLRKSPAFTITVIVTLALGIGANAAVVTRFDQVLLRMLPVERPKELVRFELSGSFMGTRSSFGGNTPNHTNYFSYPMYKDLRDRNQVFQGILAADKAEVGVSWHNQAESMDAEVVTGNYFQLLGLKPAAGRLFTSQDDTAKNANPVLVLSYSYWRTRFGAASDVAGQTVLVNGHSFTILGVAPENFDSAIGGYKPGVTEAEFPDEASIAEHRRYISGEALAPPRWRRLCRSSRNLARSGSWFRPAWSTTPLPISSRCSNPATSS